MMTLRSTPLARLVLLAAAFGGAAISAQNPTLVPLPFSATVAGLAPGSGNTACSTATDIPNNAGQHTGDGCLPTQVAITATYGAFTDAAGNIYITENGTNTDIRVIYKGGATLTQLLIAANANLTNFTPIPGRIYTLAGSLPAALTVKNGSKYSCNGQTTGPVALDSAGNGCPAAQAYLKPRGLFVDSFGNVFFVTNSPGNIARVIYSGGARVAALITAENPGVTPQVGYVYKLTGQSTASYNGDGGIASAAAYVVSRDVVVDSNSNVYISDGTSSAASGNSVRVIYAGGTPPPGIANPTLGFIYTFAGASGCAQASTTCAAGDTGDGGPATSALLNGPYTMFLDRFNNLYISEYSGNRLRVVYNSGTIPGITNPVAGNVYTYAGGGTSTADNTPANQVQLGSVQVSGIDGAGNIYIYDATAKRIWRFDALTSNGYVIAGRSSGTAPAAGAFCSGTTGPVSTDTFGDGCPATLAAFSDIGRISFDPQGNAYLGENGNGVVRRLSYNTQFPSTNVAATATQPLAFKALAAVTLATESFSVQGAATTEYNDAGSNTCAATAALTAAQVCVFNVNFTSAHDGLRPGAVQLTGATGVLTTELLSGVGIAADLALDPATQTAAGSALKPSGIVADVLGNVYVADQTGNRVLKGSVTSTTLTPIVTGLNKPSGLAVDSLGNVYIADTGNNRVLEASATGTTIATFGTGLNAPQGVAVDAFGNIFIADTGNNRVVQVAPNGVQTLSALTGLAAPTQLTFDSLGDLFVVDSGNTRLVELAVNANQTTVALPTGVVPTAIAVDPSGTLYITDSASLQLVSFAPGATVGNTLLTGLIKPVAVAVDPDGNLFAADTGLTTATFLRRSLANVTFPITNVNQTSTASINLTNVGNASLSFNSATLGTITGAGAAAYKLVPATTNGCSTGVPYTAGLGCNITAQFTPPAKGAFNASASFNTNAANTATANLIGTGQQLVTTSSTIVVTAPTGSIVYGQAVTLTATVTPTTNVGAPTGTVTFTVDNKAQTPVPYGTGTYTLTLNPAVGTHTVSVAFSGDGLYASSAATTSFIVAKATTTTTLAVNSVNAAGAISLQFTATVASATAVGETGTVSFYAGAQLLNTVPLNTATRTATYNTTTLNFGTNTFTATYSGDANFATSTSATYVPVGDFAIGSSQAAITIPQGGVADLGYVIAPLFGSTGVINASCSGLPANAACRFQPIPVTVTGSTPVQLLIYTNINTSLSGSNSTASRSGIFFAMLLPLSLFALARRSRRFRSSIVLGAVLLLATLPFTGCGAGQTASLANQGFVTPVGTSTITVTFTGTAPLTTHTTVVTLTVIANNTSF